MSHRFVVIALTASLTGCVSTGTFRAKENELAQVRREAAEHQAAADAEQRRLAKEIDRVGGELHQLGRKLASVSYERDVLRDERDQDMVMLSQLKKRLDAVGQNMDALTHEKGALAASMADALARLQEVNRQKQAADRRAATYQSLVQKLQSMITAGSLEVVIRQGRMLIVLPNDVLFDSGRTVIKPDGRDALAAVAHVLMAVNDRRFTVVGHTDDVPIHTGRFRSNWDLSTARAVEVTLFLVASGLKPEALAAAGHGEFEPVLPNDSDQHRGKNRRVEIELEPNITELPPFPAPGVAATP